MRNPYMIHLIRRIGSVAELSSEFVGFIPRALDTFPLIFFKINAIHVHFLFFLLMGEIHLQNGFPIMGHLCCITVWLMDLYIPRGDQASDADATPPLLKSGARFQFWQLWDELERFPWLQWSRLGSLPVWSLWWLMSRRAHAPSHGDRRVQSSEGTQSEQALRGMKGKDDSSPGKQQCQRKKVSVTVDKTVTHERKLLTTLMLWSCV